MSWITWPSVWGWPIVSWISYGAFDYLITKATQCIMHATCNSMHDANAASWGCFLSSSSSFVMYFTALESEPSISSKARVEVEILRSVSDSSLCCVACSTHRHSIRNPRAVHIVIAYEIYMAPHCTICDTRTAPYALHSYMWLFYTAICGCLTQRYMAALHNDTWLL